MAHSCTAPEPATVLQDQHSLYSSQELSKSDGNLKAQELLQHWDLNKSQKRSLIWAAAQPLQAGQDYYLPAHHKRAGPRKDSATSAQESSTENILFLSSVLTLPSSLNRPELAVPRSLRRERKGCGCHTSFANRSNLVVKRVLWVRRGQSHSAAFVVLSSPELVQLVLRACLPG